MKPDWPNSTWPKIEHHGARALYSSFAGRLLLKHSITSVVLPSQKLPTWDINVLRCSKFSTASAFIDANVPAVNGMVIQQLNASAVTRRRGEN